VTGAGVTETVEVAGGTLRGTETGGVLAFWSIPFAAAPTGDGRWAPPRAPAPWTGIRGATAPGPVCPQPARPFSEWAHGRLPAIDEDSLTLHVWAPAQAAAGGRPVFVFIHGGGWALGWGSNPMLDGRHLARALDAVVVTINYRLGALGWLHHPALAAGSGAPIGDWALLDQLAALRWVADNIAAFGGDPTRVTLAGESAGAGSVLHLLTVAGADGLFARAVAQSPPLHELAIGADLGVRYTEALVAHLGLGEDVAAALDGLRALPAEAIVAAQEELLAGPFRGTRGGAMPITDPAVLPSDPAEVPAARATVPLLIGTNRDEATFFFRAGGRRLEPAPDELPAMVQRIGHVEDPAEAIAAARRALAPRIPDPSTNDLLVAAITEACFAGPVRRYAAARAAAGGHVHRFRIDHPSAEGDLGAVHSIDVPLLFGTWREGGVAARLAGDGPATAAVTDALVADWRRFVAGEPLDWSPVGSGDADGGGDADGDGLTELTVYGGPAGPRSLERAA
jgi:para-nitrobenzyl esterase